MPDFRTQCVILAFVAIVAIVAMVTIFALYAIVILGPLRRLDGAPKRNRSLRLTMQYSDT